MISKKTLISAFSFATLTLFANPLKSEALLPFYGTISSGLSSQRGLAVLDNDQIIVGDIDANQANVLSLTKSPTIQGTISVNDPRNFVTIPGSTSLLSLGGVYPVQIIDTVNLLTGTIPNTESTYDAGFGVVSKNGTVYLPTGNSNVSLQYLDLDGNNSNNFTLDHPFPFGISLSPDEQTAYITHNLADPAVSNLGFMTKLNLSSGDKMNYATGTGYPWQIVTTQNGSFSYFTCNYAWEIAQPGYGFLGYYSLGDDNVYTVNYPFFSSAGLLVSNDDKYLYVIDQNGSASKIVVFDAQDQHLIGSISHPELNNPLFLIQTPNGALITANKGDSTVFIFGTPSAPSPSNLPGFTGNAGVTADIFNQINGNCPSATQNIINQILAANTQTQNQDLNQLGPQFKVIQYGLEKLDLLLQKELDNVLYSKESGNRIYLLGGFDHLTQDRSNLYNGYKINNFYQLLCFSKNWNSVKGMLGVGAAESYLKLNQHIGNASYPTVYGTLGVEKSFSRWRAGLKGLFGYSFIDAYHNINFLNAKAKTNHGAWNVSFDGKICYSFDKSVYTITPYDSLSYLYGVENNYKEYGANGANMIVKNEDISVIRNALGLELLIPMLSRANIYVDASWVYDNYLNNQGYSAAFVGTDVYGTYHQTVPTKNYGRVKAGLQGIYNRFEWKLGYSGLYGEGFLDNSINATIGAKF